MIISENIDFNRLKVSPEIDVLKKSKLGQYLTPAPIAHFMASLFDDSWSGDIKLLDAGAGIGALFAAFVEKIIDLSQPNNSIEIDAFDIDKVFESNLNYAMQMCIDYGLSKNVKVRGNIYITDFINESINRITSPLFGSKYEIYSHAILNPPYKKILNNSEYRRKLRLAGIETVNLYSAFIALAIKQLKNGGQLVAITPRSFCNGPYFKEFRKLLIKEMGIKKIHVFEYRDKAFKDDEVLQENIIFHAVKGDFPLTVELTSSSDSNFDDLTHKIVNYEEIVQINDKEYIINIPTVHQNGSFQNYLSVFKNSLDDIGINASTGKVVDFRSKQYLVDNPQKATLPLIYPMHFKDGFIEYPQKGNKPNAIIDNSEIRKLSLPKGYYVLVKRFSPKEEKRRIVVAIYNPDKINADYICFENHLNVFHHREYGLDKYIAKGLAIYLSSTFIDLYFRQFSGHTQINVSDLKKLPYPSIDILKKIGQSCGKKFPSQDKIDEIVENIILKNSNFEGANVVSIEKKIKEAIFILKELGFPRAQLNDRSGLTLLALLSLKPNNNWEEAEALMIGITPIMEFCKKYYKRDYAPNTRETFRRQTMHQFIQAGLVLENPDEPNRAINSPKWCYEITSEALNLLQSFKTEDWDKNLKQYLSTAPRLKAKYNKERDIIRIPVKISDTETITLTPGDHNILTKKIIEEFGSIFTPGGEVLYVGDTGDKFGYFNKKVFKEFEIDIDIHGKMPDVVIYYKKNDWIILIEAVTSHGPVNGKRKLELSNLFKKVEKKLVYVTCFLNKSELARNVSEISWETEVWIAENPTHLIHFNGERFLGPYDS